MAATTFNFEAIKNALIGIQEPETKSLKAINTMDEFVNTSIHIGEQSAIYGNKGKKPLDIWNKYCSIYQKFYSVFNDYTRDVIDAYNNYMKFNNSMSEEEINTIIESSEKWAAINSLLIGGGGAD